MYDKIPPFNRISALAIDNCNQSSPCWRHTSRSSSSPFFGELFMPGFTCGVASCKERQELSWAEIGATHIGATHIGATHIRGATHIILKGNPHQGQPFSRQPQSIFEHLGQPTSDAAFLQQYWFICSGSDIVYFGKHFHNIKKIGERLFTPSLTEGTLQWCPKHIEIGLSQNAHLRSFSKSPLIL